MNCGRWETEVRRFVNSGLPMFEIAHANDFMPHSSFDPLFGEDEFLECEPVTGDGTHLMLWDLWRVPAHRGLLADARAPRCRASKDAARLGRVRDPQAEPAQDRRPRRGEGRAHPHPLRFGLSGRRPVPPAGRAPRGPGPLTAGAPCPANPSPFNPKPRHYQPQIPAPQGAERQPTRA